MTPPPARLVPEKRAGSPAPGLWGAGSEAGAREREEGRLGEFPRLSPSFHKSPQPRLRPRREVHGAGVQRGGTRRLPFPPPLSFFLSLSVFWCFVLFFFKPPPLPPCSGGCPASQLGRRSSSASAAARPRRLRLAAPDSGEAKARRLAAPTVSPAARAPGAGAATFRDARRPTLRGPRRRRGPWERSGGASSPARRQSPAMVAARARAL